MVEKRYLFEDELKISNGQTLVQNGDMYYVYDVNGDKIHEGRAWKVDNDVVGMSKQELQIEMMKLRTKIGMRT